MFGPHLTLDLKFCDREKILDIAYINKFLNEFPAKIGMTLIREADSFYYSGLVPEDCGVTSFCVLAESHIAYHSFSERDNYLFMDVFSCKPFDYEAATKTILEAFGTPETTNSRNVIPRGLDFKR